MKRIAMLFLVTMMTISVYGQDYFPLIEDNKNWSVLHEIFSFPWEPTTYYTENYKIDGNTLINSVPYKKLFNSNDEIPAYWNLAYLIREDENKKTRIRELANGDEFLMYDFSIIQGDSVQVGFEPIYLHVDSISSIEINGTTRMQYHLSYDESPDYEETWIEGLGSDKGIIWCGTANFVGGWTYLLCVHENNELIYINPEYNVCYFVNTDISEDTRGSIQIFPNPAKNTISIFNPEKIMFESVSLFDISGQRVIEFDPKSTCFDVSNLKPGIYFLKIINRNEQVTKKIIVE